MGERHTGIRMEFDINYTHWKIIELPGEELNEKFGKEGYTVQGHTKLIENTIYINKDVTEKIRTLKHELMHCWLYSYGYYGNEPQFNDEDICEIVASSNDFVNEIVKKWEDNYQEILAYNEWLSQ